MLGRVEREIRSKESESLPLPDSSISCLWDGVESCARTKPRLGVFGNSRACKEAKACPIKNCKVFGKKSIHRIWLLLKMASQCLKHVKGEWFLARSGHEPGVSLSKEFPDIGMHMHPLLLKRCRICYNAGPLSEKTEAVSRSIYIIAETLATEWTLASRR